MIKYLPLILFLLTEFLVAVFIVTTSGMLPENVASHFEGGGNPNGFMSRDSYIKFILLFSLGIPAFLVLLTSVLITVGSGNIIVPNQAYWLSPANRAETVQFLRNHSTFVGIFLAVFLAYVHWVVLKANSSEPPVLSTNDLFGGVGVLFACIVVWILWFFLKFLLIPG